MAPPTVLELLLALGIVSALVVLVELVELLEALARRRSA